MRSSFQTLSNSLTLRSRSIFRSTVPVVQSTSRRCFPLICPPNLRYILTSSKPIPGNMASLPSEKREAVTSVKYTTRGNLRNEHQREVEDARKKFLEMPIDEKRKLYKCKENFTLLQDVLSWPDYFSAHLKEDEKNASWWKNHQKNLKVGVQDNLNEKLSIFRGDITTLEIDAIVNAANESLLGGGGVDGAIHSASGPLLRSECELLHGCVTGDAKITCAYKLPAKHVIHTVGPRGENAQALQSCYTKCLQLMKEQQLTTIAFPCISTGIFGYPNVKAACVALSSIRTFLEEDDYGPKVERVILCLFMKKDVDIYHEQMQLFFPLPQDSYTGQGQQSQTSESENETDRAEKGTDRAEQGTDRAEKGTDKAEKGTDRAEQGKDRAEKGTDRAEKGTDRADKGTDREEKGTDRADKGTDRADKGTDREEKGTDREEKGMDRAEKKVVEAEKDVVEAEKAVDKSKTADKVGAEKREAVKATPNSVLDKS